jgi:protein-tyrosine phosphatase
MAQAVFDYKVAEKGLQAEFQVDSAATSREELGNPVHHGTCRKLRAEGIPVPDHRAVQMTKSDYDRYDYLIAMDSQNVRNIYRIIGSDDDRKVYKLLDFTERKGDIADPWYTGNFDETYTDIDEGCDGLLRFLSARQTDTMN